MLVPIFLCSFFGIYLDKRFHTSFWFFILFFMGAIAGGRNCYYMSMKIFKNQDEKEEGAANRGRKRDTK